jgi:hypothetical protein
MTTTKDAALLKTLKQSELLALCAVRLLESHSRVGDLRRGSLPENASQSTQVGVQGDDKKNTVLVVVKYGLLIAYDEKKIAEDPDGVAITLRANFGVQYDIKPGGSRKGIDEAARRLAVINSWPFWREFAQSMTVRMGLPAFPVPLMNAGSLVADDDSAPRRGRISKP